MQKSSPYISTLLGALIAGFISMLSGCAFAKYLGYNWPGSEELACSISGQEYGIIGAITGAIFSFLLTSRHGDKIVVFFGVAFVVLVVMVILSFVWLGINAI